MKTLVFIALSLISFGASAGPLLWTFGGGGTLTGSFVYNADTDAYSSVSFSETHFGDFYTGISSGNANGFTAFSDGFGDQTVVSFVSPLTNAGGVINYNGTTTCFSICAEPNPNTYTGTVSAQAESVPEPGVLSLLAVGLLGLGLSRKRLKA